MVRGAVDSMIYKRACSLSTRDADPAASVTLMSADIEQIVQAWQTMHDIWVTLWKLRWPSTSRRQLGVACVVPVAVAVDESFNADVLDVFDARIDERYSKCLGYKLRLDELRISQTFSQALGLEYGSG
ncbi:uncharacterized protein BP01DRAFT_383672 [Aspergillus saccharolyticus JOP 1030-1]|uniref:Uncharacterized protein n=1 Tax=Aspergillus saccharolyticus JOP 1030-1 TaxID=1450539 RepID=A0A318ZDY1_9EURO|nr:hypothetical protein BP01DRAFT_383672 [Aspergillus saccharolyticus JOP 1030-1]PYH44494.1 hypothetical protein BP01DRAFT_383672 [Aspergillus saccharolyticus JOP 1030-1]